MMKSLKAIFIFSALLAIVPIGARAQAEARENGVPQVREFKMTARKYRFDPKVITVKQGDTVRLIITALDHDHGFELKAYGINQKLNKGDPATIEFTASKAGTFTFHCSVFCGLGHRRMKGRLIVESRQGP
jgi:heme/copper-type cytochrome/quinol oxidase subunit 2